MNNGEIKWGGRLVRSLLIPWGYIDMPVRIKAFLLHLAASSIIALLVVLLVFLVWYPAPLHVALGVTDIFLLLLLIDVILGPVLTLMVYKAGKKTLIMDLAVIACLQLAALSYGLWTVAEGRPAWLVFNSDRFDAVTVVDIDKRWLNEARAEYRSVSLTGLRWVGAEKPDNPDQRGRILFESLQGGSDIAQHPSLYQPLANMLDAMHLRAQPLERLYEFNDTHVVDRMLLSWPDAQAWLPLKARSKPMVVLLGKGGREVLGIVDLSPWN